MTTVDDRNSVSVSHGIELPVRAALAWAPIRDFNAMPAWNASVRQSRIENGPADRVGCLRVLVFDDGGAWTHRLTGLSDADMKLQYSIVATPQPMRIPVWNYRAEIQVSGISDLGQDGGQVSCRIQWRAEFETAHAEEMSARARQVFDQGFVGLRRLLGC